MKHKRLNWSTLKYIATSPKLLKWRVEHPRPETSALRLGRAIHCLILEPEVFDSRWVTAGNCVAVKKSGAECESQGTLYHLEKWFCRVRGHAPEEATETPEGMEILTAGELDLVRVCAEAVKTHAPSVSLLSNGDAEQELEWTDAESGIKCRGRLDYLRGDFVVDVKSSRRDTVRDFAMDAARNLYHGQLAWYHDGAVAAGRLAEDALRPAIIQVSTAEPYDVAAYRIDSSTLAAGRILYRDLLKKYQACTGAEWWPGIAPDLLDLELPAWAPGMQGPEEYEDEW